MIEGKKSSGGSPTLTGSGTVTHRRTVAASRAPLTASFLLGGKSGNFLLYIQANLFSAGLLLTLSNKIRPIKIKVNTLLPCPEQSGEIRDSVF